MCFSKNKLPVLIPNHRNLSIAACRLKYDCIFLIQGILVQTPVEMVIAFDLPADQVLAIYQEYWKLDGMYKLAQIYDEARITQNSKRPRNGKTRYN